MNTYKIAVKQIWDSGVYPWVQNLGPLADNSYIQRMPPSLRDQQEKSLKINDAKSGLHINGGSEWSDIIGYGGVYPEFFVSEHLINCLKKENIPLLNIIHAPIADVAQRDSKLLLGPLPNYYLIEAHHGMNKSWKHMGYHLNIDGTPDLTTRPNPLCPLCLDSKTWNGHDVFCLNEPLWTTSLYCTERILELAEKHQWTNVAFESVNVV